MTTQAATKAYFSRSHHMVSTCTSRKACSSSTGCASTTRPLRHIFSTRVARTSLRERRGLYENAFKSGPPLVGQTVLSTQRCGLSRGRVLAVGSKPGLAAILDSGCSIERADCDEIIFSNTANVADADGNDCTSLARRCHKLNFQPIGLIYLDHRAEVPSPQTVRGKVPRQYNSVQNLEIHGHLSGIMVISRGAVSPLRTIQMETTATLMPLGPSKILRTPYFWP